MDPTFDHHRRRLLIAAIAGGLILVLLVGIGVYGLLRGPAQPAGPGDRTPGTPARAHRHRRGRPKRRRQFR